MSNPENTKIEVYEMAFGAHGETPLRKVNVVFEDGPQMPGLARTHSMCLIVERVDLPNDVDGVDVPVAILVGWGNAYMPEGARSESAKYDLQSKALDRALAGSPMDKEEQGVFKLAFDAAYMRAKAEKGDIDCRITPEEDETNEALGPLVGFCDGYPLYEKEMEPGCTTGCPFFEGLDGSKND